MSEFVYLYGYVPGDAPAPDHLAGLVGQRVMLQPAGSLRAIVSTVPAEDYAPERLEARLQDLTWVAEQGVAHERVVAWFVDHSEVLPAPLFTMYSSLEALRSATAERDDELVAQLERLRGLREWDVKITYDQPALEQSVARISDEVAALDQQMAAASAGKRYLLQKKRAELLKTEVRRAAHRRAVDVLNAVSGMVVQTRNLPIPPTQEALPVVLHAALLTRSEHERQLTAELETQANQLRTIGMNLSFSGPWAAYRFMGEHD